MECSRCKGLLLPTHFSNDCVWEYDGWKCLICGNVTDPLIASNKEAQAHGRVEPMTSRGMQPARGVVNPRGSQGSSTPNIPLLL